jgi:cytidine deaminase
MDKIEQELLTAASKARQQAYMPYSHYAVGAALLTEHGEIIGGCNVENASYGLSFCAERTAAVKAISEGKSKWKMLAVVTANGGTPCGACRQFLAEFQPELPILVADAALQDVQRFRLEELLPHSFSKAKL